MTVVRLWKFTTHTSTTLSTSNIHNSLLTFHKLPRKKKKPAPPVSGRSSFNEKLSGFDIKINSFGEMESTFEIDQLNKFLNEEVKDKKLKKDPDEEE